MISPFIPVSMKACPLKKLITTALCMLVFAFHARAQVVNQVQIIPANPTAADSIYVVADFSYYGNCPYGLVYNYSWITDSTIHTMPTYCGYGDTTLCNSIDTFSLGIYPQGNYLVTIEFHQGSVCPASGFDAIIAYFDTSVTVGPSAGVGGEQAAYPGFLIYPNPVSVTLFMKGNFNNGTSRLTIFNVLGLRVLMMDDAPSEIPVAGLTAGVYSICLEQNGTIVTTKFVKR